MKIKKFIMIFMLAVLIFNPRIAKAESIDTGIELQSEDYIWRYRTYNGRTQKRLWSARESIWLSDWIYV